MKEISEEQEGEDDTESETQREEFTQEAGTEETVEFEEKIVEEPIVMTETDNRVRAVTKPRANTQGEVVKENEGSVICQECDATFGTKMGLLYHRRNKHEGKTYICDECDAVFTPVASPGT